MTLTTEQQLKLISKAWGRQSGYCFFPWISGDAKDKSERIQSYHEGPAFMWPKDKAKIIAHMKAHGDDDLYWCPSLFERDRRQLEFAMDEHALWADLDEVDPRTLKDYPPTIAWETSPDHYQALWLTQGDIQGASWPGRENQRLTYYIGADVGGWDTTQLMRIPGWKNHKPERKVKGKAIEGEVLWVRGRTYLVDEFNDLPEVTSGAEISLVLEDEVDSIDRHEVWGRVRLKVTKEVRDLVGAREVLGDRSDKLWQIERDLADAGCTVPEIVAIVRATVWNKFAGRQDELRRLSTEASKAIALRPEEVVQAIEEDRETKPEPTRLFSLVRNVKAPKWLVRDVLSEGACGFIAGQPKSFKTWCGMDLALSIATGMPFLGHFDINDPGPVLYIQEEDSLPMVKRRLDKVWPGKIRDTIQKEGHDIIWSPAIETEDEPDPPIDAYIGQGLVISDPGWQAWLDETIGKGEYKAVIMDPLMMLAGEVEENRSQEMTTKLFKPVKQLARKHGCAMVFVHHMKKGDPKTPQRGGQLMLGSVANHAWAEDSLYLRLGRGGDVIVEQESKSAPLGGFKVTHVRNLKWEPEVIPAPREDDESTSHSSVVSAEPSSHQGRATGRRSTQSKAQLALVKLGPGTHTTQKVAEAAGVASNSAYKQLTRLVASGGAVKVGTQWALVEERS